MEGTQGDAGFEAPRNSLDGASSVETNAHKFEDVAFCQGVCNQASDKRWNREARDEKKLRAPNVVARLMGLNTMPELLPTQSSSRKMSKNGADPVAKSRRTPVRDDHPQEAELQRFKQEFAAKQHLDDMKRQLEEKKLKVRATLDKARLALSQGIIASSPKLRKEFENSKEFLEALEFLQCNKDFIFQFLQQKPNAVFSNNGTTTPVTTHAKQGIQGTEATQAMQATQRTQARQAAKALSDSTQRGFSPRSLARLFMHSNSRKENDHNKLNPKPAIEGRTAQSPTAIHRPSSGDLIPDDVKRRSPTSTSSRYMLPTSPKSQIKQATKGSTNKKNSARDVIAEIKERLRRREHQPNENIHCTKTLPNSEAREPASSPRTTNFTLTKSLSTGKRISMLRPDVDDNEEISSPKAVLSDYLTDSPSATLRVKTRKTKTSSVQASETDQKKSNATESNHVKVCSPGKKKLLHCVNEAVSSPNFVKASESSHQKSNAIRSNLVKLDSPGKKHFLHSVNDAPSSPNLARCRSVPNAAMLRGNCTNGVDVAQNATTPKVPKPARNTQNGTQDGTLNGDKRMLFSVDSKKGSKVGHETTEAMPSPSRAAALAESCVSQRMQSNPGPKDGNGAYAKVRRNILDHVRDGRDATSDKNGRDSRVVSVLEPPFQEFKDITNVHQDPLRIRLRCPKREGSSERVRDNESDDTREKHRDARRSSEVPPPSQTKTPTPQITPKRPRSPSTPSSSTPSPASDFAFVRDILVASGFHTHGGRNITQWHSSAQPISPHLLKKMQTTSRKISTRSSHHRILFDAINEILITKLELSSAATPAHHCFGLPIVIAPRNAAVSGRRFVEDVWSEIRKRRFSTASSEKSLLLHSLVAQEVQPAKSWLLLRRDIDRICLQVEKAVWEELVEEVCYGLLAVKQIENAFNWDS